MSMFKKLLGWLCKKQIEHTYRLYNEYLITPDEASERNFFWETIYAKWVRGECHHLCMFCHYKYECWSNAKDTDFIYADTDSVKSKGE